MNKFLVLGLAKAVLATITVNGDKATMRRSKAAMAAGKCIAPSNDRDLCAAARYLTKERAAVSAVACGYTVSKLQP